MKRFLSVLLLSAAASAQTPTPPHTSTVTGKSEAGNGHSISIADGRSTSSMSRSGNLAPALKKAFRQLQVGRAYAFPDAFSTPSDDSAEFEPASLLGLEQRIPFRALVDEVQVMELRVVLRLCCADGKKVEFVHTGATDHDKAASMVSRLQPEETYEFPAILEGKKPTPPADGGGPLAQYVGEWRGTLEGDSSFYITMNCAWTAEGQGMWREIMYDDSSEAPPVYDVAIVTAKGGGTLLLASDPRQKDKPAIETAYEASSRTFTTRLPSSDPGLVRINTATFTNDDTIAWKTVSQNEDGEVLATTSGSYHRLAKKPLSASPGQISSVPPPNRWASSGPATTKEVLGLPALPPFRATVVKRHISPSAIQLDLKIDDDITVTLGHAGQENWDKAKAMVAHLEEGRTYDFPDALAEGYLAPPPGAVPQPASEAMRALAPFVGTWESEIGPERQKVIIRYFWNDDGTGLWRESRNAPLAPGPNGKKQEPPHPQPRPTLITYDTARQCYAESPSVVVVSSESTLNGMPTVSYALGAPASLPRSQMSLWNPTTQTYTWQYTQDQPKPNTQISGTRRLVSPDRIEWQSRRTEENGRLVEEHSGHYDRVRP